jgi:hypothetical protein
MNWISGSRNCLAGIILRWGPSMNVEEIEEAIAQLPPCDLAELMAWLQEFHAQAWDKQMEEDVEAGRLDALLAEVEEEYGAGLARPR